MADQQSDDVVRSGRTAPRREVLIALGGVAATGLAGCSQLTSQEFSADKVVLPKNERGELVLAETASESTTVTRTPSAGGVEGEVKITSHTAGYSRAVAWGGK